MGLYAKKDCMHEAHLLKALKMIISLMHFSVSMNQCFPVIPASLFNVLLSNEEIKKRFAYVISVFHRLPNAGRL